MKPRTKEDWSVVLDAIEWFQQQLRAKSPDEVRAWIAPLAPTSQPSRGKCETFPINGGYVVTEKESSRCIHGVQLVQRGAAGYRACEKCFAFLHPSPDCAQPERQDMHADGFGGITAGNARIPKEYSPQPERQGAGKFPADYNGRELYDLAPKKRPSPPQDDIVALARMNAAMDALILAVRCNERCDDKYTREEIQDARRAIAALGEKGAK